MKSKYLMISAGIVLLLVVAIALVWAQTKQMQKPSGQEGATTNEVTVAPKTAYYGESSQQFEVKILSPQNGASVSSAQLVVRGTTKPNAEIFINDKEATADANGNFSVTLTLDEGDNLIIVTANDENGNVAEKELLVTYNIEG